MNTVIRTMERTSPDIWTAQVEIGPFAFPVLVEVSRSGELEGFNFGGTNGRFMNVAAMYHGLGMYFNRDFWALVAGGGPSLPWSYSDFEAETLDQIVTRVGAPQAAEDTGERDTL